MNEQATIWANTLGMLPVNFLHGQDVGIEKYAMLNGYTNNFCLSFNNDIDIRTARNSVWSANMVNYVSIDHDNLLLFSLNKPDPEQISYHYVMQNLPQFYEYLGINQISLQDGVVPFVMSHYRMVRNALREENAAGNALKAFLYMLSQMGNEAGDVWNLPEGTEAVVAEIGAPLFEQVKQGFREGLKKLQLIPDIKILLRHCAGMLFQEANYLARFSSQLELFPTEIIRYEMNPKMMGSYYTPSYIARTIVEETLRYANIQERHNLTIFDPACGSGVFLIEVLHQLQTRGYQGHVDVIGWDIDPVAIDMANFILQFEKSEWGVKMEYHNSPINSLNVENQWPNADIILMNPPYISWSNMTPEQREQASAILNPRIRPNMASIFYYQAAHSLNTNGVIGCLMPSSFLTADSHSSIRRETNGIIAPRLIAHLGNFVFTSAMADVSIIIASNNRRNDNVQMLWTKNVDEVIPIALRSLRRGNNQSMISFGQGKDYNIYFDSYHELIEKDIWIPLPIQSIHQRRFLEQRMQMGGLVKAEDLFEIMMGARTGANDVFIISSAEYRNIPVKERIYFRPSVDSTSLKDGILTISNYLFYPYPENDIGFADEEDLKRKIPYVYHHFFENKMPLLMNREVKNGKWWLLSRPGAWQYKPVTKIVSTEFGKAGCFAYDKKGEYVVERGMAWIPCNREVSSEFYYFYIAILNSRYFNSLLQIYARQLAGGDLYNLEGKFMRNIPLPAIETIEEQTIDVLVSYGKKICKEGNREIEGLTGIVRKLYGE
ncbi:MAG: N-6 DNA methylase [Bacteroidales bacterium]|nr:N-6 DNA methylase [Bacteroidales bacterium]